MTTSKPPRVFADVQLIETLRGALSKFVRLTAQSLVVEVSDDDLLDRFLKWLMNLNHGDPPPVATSPDTTIDDASSIDTNIGSLDYFFARFVEESVDNDPVLANSIPNLWAVGMLLEVADEITKPAALSQKSDLKIVVDAPVALNYLGMAGKKSQEGIVLVLDSLRAIGCKIAIFDISCQEINRTLSSLLNNSPADRYGRTADALKAKEVTLERVEYIRDHPDTALAEADVEILPFKLESTKNLERHFSFDLYEDYLNSVGWGDTVDAKIHDAMAFALTMRLRHGHHSSDFFRNKIIFITLNQNFFRSSRKYALKSHILNEHHIPPVFTTKRLATIAWLQTGLNIANTEIPKGILVNVCAKITSTRRDIIDQARDDIASLTPEKQAEFRALATHPRSTRVLMDYYESRPHVLDGENAAELLAKMEAALAEEHDRRAAETVASVRAEADAELGRAQDKLENLTHSARKHEERADQLLKAICDQEVSNGNSNSRYSLITLITILITITIIFTFSPNTLPEAIRWPAVTASIIITSLSTYFTFFTSSGPAINRVVGDFWASRVSRKLQQRGISPRDVRLTVSLEGQITWTPN